MTSDVFLFWISELSAVNEHKFVVVVVVDVLESFLEVVRRIISLLSAAYYF